MEKTVIVVSHKRDVLKEADSVLLVNGGEVVHGSYEELLTGYPEFKEMLGYEKSDGD